MPINFQQAVEKIRQMGARAMARQTELERLRTDALRLLRENAGALDELRDLAQRASSLQDRLRCAVPLNERLDLSQAAAPAVEGLSLLAADGSQINPDRHGAVEFAAINVGAIRIRSGEAPRVWTDSQFKFNEELYHQRVPLNDLDIAIWRDLAERRRLFELAQEDAAQGYTVVALTDGPLQLFGQAEQSQFYKDNLREYLQVLGSLSSLGAAVAGYVDKPRSDYLVALLDLVKLQKDNRLGDAGKEKPFWPVRDMDLFTHILEPGQRSAIFELHMPEPAVFTDELALHFFYLNIGRAGKPQLARVELPRWVAENGALVERLHGALLEQAAQMGSRPYPYILHRAHETAVVHLEEKEQLENMIQLELRRQGAAVGEQSNKQAGKELAGRTRMK